MDNNIHIEELTAEQIAAWADQPEGLSELIFSNSDDWEGTDRVAMSDSNGWQTIHFLLAGDAWEGPWPLNFMASTSVGTVVSYDEEYPPAKLYSAQKVQVIAKALDGIATEALIARFDADDDELHTFDCPYDAYESEEEFLSESVAPLYEEIKLFVANAAAKNRGLLVAYTIL